MACVNLLGLNNELYCSHLQLKLRILEMGVQASLSDLRDIGQTMALSVHAENAAQLMRWIYDLVVLDPNEDTSKKASTKVRFRGYLSLFRPRFSLRLVGLVLVFCYPSYHQCSIGLLRSSETTGLSCSSRHSYYVVFSSTCLETNWPD
jgi:hypothetical protein